MNRKTFNVCSPTHPAALAFILRHLKQIKKLNTNARWRTEHKNLYCYGQQVKQSRQLFSASPLVYEEIFMNTMPKSNAGGNFSNSRGLVSRLVIISSFSLFMAACASTPEPPAQEINSAEQSLLDAEQTRVGEYALPELQEARFKLNAARDAVKSEDMVMAKRMAEQASMDIKLASAKADLAKAQAVNDGMRENIHALKQEMNRNSGEQQ